MLIKEVTNEKSFRISDRIIKNLIYLYYILVGNSDELYRVYGLRYKFARIKNQLRKMVPTSQKNKTSRAPPLTEIKIGAGWLCKNTFKREFVHTIKNKEI